jgi:hypothetical protein
MSGTTDRTTQTGETAGIDLGDRVSRYCLLNEGGQVIEEGTFRNTESSMRKCFGQWGRTSSSVMRYLTPFAWNSMDAAWDALQLVGGTSWWREWRRQW